MTANDQASWVVSIIPRGHSPSDHRLPALNMPIFLSSLLISRRDCPNSGPRIRRTSGNISYLAQMSSTRPPGGAPLLLGTGVTLVVN
jgi:hypothetical protein